MGLSPTAESSLVTSSPAIAPAPKGILDPATGKPVGAGDPFFLEVNHELSDKGFFVAAADDLITILIEKDDFCKANHEKKGKTGDQALATLKGKGQPSNKKCSNCGCTGHMNEDCY